MKNKNPDGANTTGMDKEKVLCCVLHHPMDTETQHPTWKIKETRLISGAQVVGRQ
jgi:hypothetical protein